MKRWCRASSWHAVLCFSVLLTAVPTGQAQEVQQFGDFFLINGELVGGYGPVLKLDLDGKTRTEAMSAWAQKNVKSVLATADRVIREKPTAFGGYGLKYLAMVDLKKDRAEARKVAMQATAALTKKPDQLVEFVRRVLFASAGIEEYRIARMALTPLVPDSTGNAVVRIAHLRALMGCGRVKEAVITNKNIVKDLTDDAKGLRALAKAICEMENGRSLAHVARKAMEVADQTLPADQDSLKTKYVLLKGLMGAHAEATKVAHEIVKTVSDAGLNNFVWYLMTTKPDEGRFPEVALIGAQRMLNARSIKNNEYDTIALAFYRSGLFDEAIEYQQTALNMGKAGDADYQKRMAMYKAAKKKRDAEAAAEAKGGQPGKQSGKTDK